MQTENALRTAYVKMIDAQSFADVAPVHKRKVEESALLNPDAPRIRNRKARRAEKARAGR